MKDNSKFLNVVTLGQSENVLKELEDNSIDLVLTDPPYFLDKLDSSWNPDKVNSKKNQYTIKSLPAGMKFSREQGKQLYNWYLEISEEIFRVLKPGGFFYTFSSPRLYHRVASAVDDAGFEIRDSFMWLYTKNQPKGMSLNHIIKRRDLSESEKENLIQKLEGWKTPQIKSCYEPIVTGQKPYKKSYLDNAMEFEVGLINTDEKVGLDKNMHPANVISTDYINNDMDRCFLVNKPSKKEKGDYNTHKTVKPIELCEHLINLTALSKDAIILDPFVGSGTTAIASQNLNKNFIAIEINKEYVDISNRRLKENKEHQTIEQLQIENI